MAISTLGFANELLKEQHINKALVKVMDEKTRTCSFEVGKVLLTQTDIVRKGRFSVTLEQIIV